MVKSKRNSETSSLKKKRPRAESSEDEVHDVVNKKAKNDSEEGSVSSNNQTVTETNNVEENRKELIDVERISQNETEKQNKGEDSDNEKSIDNKNKQTKKIKTPKRAVEKTTEDKDISSSKKSLSNTDISNILEKEENDNVMNSKKKQSEGEDSEVVDGLELSVECASDKAVSSSESDSDKTEKPRGKTEIVKAQPNDSELDVSSSEAEKSADDGKTDIKKNGKRKNEVSGKSFKKSKSSATENTSDDSSDNEDNTLQTKKKKKKLPVSKRSPQKAREQKKGQGHSKKDTSETNNEEDKEDSSEHDDNGNSANDEHKVVSEDKEKGEEEISSKSSSSSSNVDDSEHEESKKHDEQKKRSVVKPEDDKRIQSLKKYVRAAGITVKSYQELWAGCKSNAARIRCLKELLDENGISGRPTLEKCKKIKEKLERQKELAELDTKNIISEGRVTRARRNKSAGKEPESPNTPSEYEPQSTFKRIKNIIDSDSE